MNSKNYIIKVLIISCYISSIWSCKEEKIIMDVEANYIEPTFLLGVKNSVKERIKYNQKGEMLSKEMVVSSISRNTVELTIQINQKFDYLGNAIESKNFTNGKLDLIHKEKYNSYNLLESVFRLDYNPNTDLYDTTNMVCHYNNNYSRAWRVTNGDTIGLIKLSFNDTIIQTNFNLPDTINSTIIEKTIRDKNYKKLYYEKKYPEGLSDKILYEYDMGGKLVQITNYSENKIVLIEKFKRGVKKSKSIFTHSKPIEVKYKTK